MRSLILCVSLIVVGLAKADTDYEWQAKAAAAAINLSYEQPPLLTETNKAPWIISPGVNNQQPPTVRVQSARVVSRPFVSPDTVAGAILGVADPNNCPPEG
jgi:hypothetical protein